MPRLALLIVMLTSVISCSVISCAPAPPPAPKLALSADRAEAPADGISMVHLAAHIAEAPNGAVVVFEIHGVGLLTSSNATITGGKASTAVYAPFEAELPGGTSSTSTILAHVTLNGATLTSSRTVTFTVPTTGAPVLTAHTTPDRVVAGGTDPITIVVDGRRLAGTTVALASDNAAVAVPTSLTLDEPSPGRFHAELAIPPPADPTDATVTLTATGAPPVTVVLHFIASDAAAFDLNGTFAEVSYGVVQIGNLVFLDPDPQCVVAPTLLLVNIVQTGAHLSITSTTCDVQMPAVNVVLVGQSTTTVGPGFVQAANAHNPGPMDFDLAAVTQNAPFDPPASVFVKPLIVGAVLANDSDPMPTASNDPRVRDDDNDGQPGVTVNNSSEGPQNFVFRTRTFSMTGTIESSDVIDGTASSDTENNILDGSVAPTVTGEPSPFFFQRVDGKNGAPDISARDGDASSISCDDVKAFATELGTIAPPPDLSTACQ